MLTILLALLLTPVYIFFGVIFTLAGMYKSEILRIFYNLSRKERRV